MFIYKKVLTFDEGYALHAMIINFILLINKPYTLIIKKKTVLVVYVNYYEQKKTLKFTIVKCIFSDIFIIIFNLF